jgi:hypothetical protein
MVLPLALGVERLSSFEEKMAVHRVSLFLLTLLGLSTSCTQFAHLEIRPGGCINPAGGVCPTSGDAADSRILELRLYQLKDMVPVCKLDLNAFTDGSDKDLDLLKAALADAQHKDVVRQIEQVEAKKSRALAKWQLHPDTKYILAVALGLSKEKNSVRLLKKSDVTDGAIIYIRGNSLCLVGSCETSMEEQCP